MSYEHAMPRVIPTYIHHVFSLKDVDAIRRYLNRPLQLVVGTAPHSCVPTYTLRTLKRLSNHEVTNIEHEYCVNVVTEGAAATPQPPFFACGTKCKEFGTHPIDTHRHHMPQL